MRVVVDTSVIISALLFPHGASGAVLTRLKTRHQWVISLAMAAELGAVIVRPKFDRLGTPKMRVRVVQDVLSAAHIVPVVPAFRISHPQLQDPDDLPILEAALAGQADLIVSSDQDLLRLGSLPKPEVVESLSAGTSRPSTIPIVSPQAALAHLDSSVSG